MNKANNESSLIKPGILGTPITVFAFVSTAFTQGQVVQNGPAVAQNVEESSLWWYLMAAFVILLVSAVALWYQKKSAIKATALEKPDDNECDTDALDFDAEIAWFKKNTRIKKKKKKREVPRDRKSDIPKGIPRPSKVLNENGLKRFNDANEYLKNGREKLQKIQFDKLPINNFEGLNPLRPYDQLALSNDDGLMSAIEQVHEEYEEDIEVRELALRILAKFRKRNSIEALSQIVLYDVTSQLRSKAVTILAEFDHESVFDTVLLACADPTREVRAAAARALFQLSFDRGEAWTRLAWCEDNFKIIQSARAAIESNLVERSIDRLVHKDEKYAYEAFALIALLVKAGETKEIFEVIENHTDRIVKLAIFRTLKVLKDETVLPDLYSFVERNSLNEELSFVANEVIKSCELVTA